MALYRIRIVSLNCTTFFDCQSDIQALLQQLSVSIVVYHAKHLSVLRVIFAGFKCTILNVQPVQAVACKGQFFTVYAILERFVD